MTTQLVLGASKCDRSVERADELAQAYRQDSGYRYLEYEPITDPNLVCPEDLAVTLLVNSRVGLRAFISVQDRGPELDLTSLLDRALEHTTDRERRQTAEIIATVARWPGFAASSATKVLHKKRPALIPILDNQAIFGAYMNPQWPQQRSSQNSVWEIERIEDALNRIAYDLTRSENACAWQQLSEIEPNRTRIELFDMVWWGYFRQAEPVG